MKAIRFGVCLSFLLLIFATVIPAQEQEPQVLIRSSAARPEAGTSWTLTLLIAHNEPNDVNVFAPHFPDALFLDQVLKGPRYFNPATGQSVSSLNENAETREEQAKTFELWTAMEYRFMLIKPETVVFEEFTVVTPQGQAKTKPFTLAVQRPQVTGAAGQNYRLAWEGVPAALKTGESAVVTLRITNWNSAAALTEAAKLPLAERFMPPVPPGHIAESLPLSAEEKAAGRVLSLRITPLAALPFTAERRVLAQGAANFEIPAIRIPVSARSNQDRASRETAPSQKTVPEKSGPAAFPLLETAAKQYPKLYERYRAECENIYGTAKNLWERGYRANSLAALRKNERDHRAGALFSAIRREAERAAGFTETNGEKAQSLFSFFGRKPVAAVLKETSLRRIPDAAGEEIARCGDGQPVLVAPLAGRGGTNGGAQSGGTDTQRQESWRQITTNDSRALSGWVLEVNIIFY